jgi:hypothetical protein
MDTVGDAQPLAAHFERSGCECVLFPNGRMKLILPDVLEVRDVYRAAASHNVVLRKLTYRRDSLEDIFWRAMQGNGHTPAPAAAPVQEAANGGL